MPLGLDPPFQSACDLMVVPARPPLTRNHTRRIRSQRTDPSAHLPNNPAGEPIAAVCRRRMSKAR